MKLPKKQEEGSSKDITAASLAGKLIAVRARELGESVTKYSEGEVVPFVEAQVFAVTDDGSTVYEGTTRFYQTYLVDSFSDATDDWLVGRIVKGDRAWLFDAPADSELTACEKAVAALG